VEEQQPPGLDRTLQFNVEVKEKVNYTFTLLLDLHGTFYTLPVPLTLRLKKK